MSIPNDPAANPQPDVDLTVGSTPIIGNAPPSDGTGVAVSVAPTTGLGQAAEALKDRLALEGLSARPVDGHRLHRAPAAAAGGAAAGFHTASARAAAFPGLQSEIESSGSTGAHSVSTAGAVLPAD
jgi:hypothetical protein